MWLETEQLNISSTHLYVYVYYVYKSNLAKSQIMKEVRQYGPHCHAAEVEYLWTMEKNSGSTSFLWSSTLLQKKPKTSTMWLND